MKKLFILIILIGVQIGTSAQTYKNQSTRINPETFILLDNPSFTGYQNKFNFITTTGINVMNNFYSLHNQNHFSTSFGKAGNIGLNYFYTTGRIDKTRLDKDDYQTTELNYSYEFELKNKKSPTKINIGINLGYHQQSFSFDTNSIHLYYNPENSNINRYKSHQIYSTFGIGFHNKKWLISYNLNNIQLYGSDNFSRTKVDGELIRKTLNNNILIKYMHPINEKIKIGGYISSSFFLNNPLENMYYLTSLRMNINNIVFGIGYQDNYRLVPELGYKTDHYSIMYGGFVQFKNEFLNQNQNIWNYHQLSLRLNFDSFKDLKCKKKKKKDADKNS